jgi:hypothetical protein
MHHVAPPSPPSADGLLPKAVALVGLGGAAAAVFLALTTPTVDRETREWTFAGLARMPSSYGLETPVTAAGEWTVDEAPDATVGRVLTNHPGTSDEEPALALVEGMRARDVDLSTRCRGGCGVAFRLRDARNLYVARADGDGRHVILAVVVDGRERELGRHVVSGRAGEWIHVGARARGDVLEVLVDDEAVIVVRDGTLPGVGAKGVWAAPLGSASFDVLTVRPDS